VTIVPPSGYAEETQGGPLRLRLPVRLLLRLRRCSGGRCGCRCTRGRGCSCGWRQAPAAGAKAPAAGAKGSGGRRQGARCGGDKKK